MQNRNKTVMTRSGNRGVLTMLFALAWPTMLEQLMQTAVQYIDTAMVGSLGTAATAAVGSTTTVNWLIGSTISAIGVGFLAFISQSLGAGRTDRIKDAVAQAMLTVLAIGSLFTLVTLLLSGYIPRWMQVDESIADTASTYFFILYTPMIFRAATIIFGTLLRAAKDTKTPMKVGIAVNIANVSLNFLLIYPTRRLSVLGIEFFMPGAGLGVVGAGIASAIAFAIGGILITVALLRHPTLSPIGVPLKPDADILRSCFRVALPNALQRFGTSLGYVAFAAMVNSLGDISTAAHTVANTVESAFYVPGYGMQAAAATLAGNAYGSKDNDRLRSLGRVALTVEVALMTVSGALLFIGAPAMVRIFSSDPEVITLGTTVLRMVAISEPFYGASIIMEGMMQGMGRTLLPFVASVTGMWAVRIVGTFICTQMLDLGLVSAWACMILHNLLLFVTFAVYYITHRKNMIGKASVSFRRT